MGVCFGGVFGEDVGEEEFGGVPLGMGGLESFGGKVDVMEGGKDNYGRRRKKLARGRGGKLGRGRGKVGRGRGGELGRGRGKVGRGRGGELGRGRGGELGRGRGEVGRGRGGWKREGRLEEGGEVGRGRGGERLVNDLAACVLSCLKSSFV